MKSNDLIRCEYLLKHYKNRIVVGRKSANEILSWLKKAADIEHIPLSAFNTHFLESFYFNVANTNYSKIHEIKKENIHLQAYKLVQTELNKRYYNSMTSTPKFIYLIIDIYSAQIQSNCGLLFLEMSIQRGINQSDIDACSPFLKEYLIQIDQLNSCY